MSISKKLLEIAKIKLLNYSNIHKYISFYQVTDNHICNFTIKNLKLLTKVTSIFLQIAIVLNMSTKYARIISTIKSEWKNKMTDLKGIILQIVKYKAIWKKNKAITIEKLTKTTILLLFKLAKLESF